MAPGIDSETANTSIISSSFFTQPLLVITSLSIIGIIAYPPPKVTDPILKKVMNISISNLILVLLSNKFSSKIHAIIDEPTVMV
jgi:hypothetical protein